MALADGFKIFLPNVPQKQYHFTNYRQRLRSGFRFQSGAPDFAALQENRTDGYELEGAMFTARKYATEEAAKRTRAAQRGALAQAREFLHAAHGRARAGRGLEGIRPGRLDRDAGRLRAGRRALDSSRFSAGWCTSIRLKPIRRKSGRTDRFYTRIDKPIHAIGKTKRAPRARNALLEIAPNS